MNNTFLFSHALIYYIHPLIIKLILDYQVALLLSNHSAYAKKDFYDELKKMVTNLEDKLIAKANNAVLELEQQKDFIYSVHEDTKNIVKLVNKNYHKF